MSPVLLFFNPFYLCNVDRVFCIMSLAIIFTSGVWPVDAWEILQYNDLPDFVMCQSILHDVSSHHFHFCGLACWCWGDSAVQ